MLTDFYVAFATVCFTLLGLWIIVVQTPPWRVAPQSCPSTAGLWGCVIHFSPPGLMSLLSLVDPASTDLWRISLPSSPLVASWPWPWCGVRRRRAWARRPM
jgi:hypothetical protein